MKAGGHINRHQAAELKRRRGWTIAATEGLCDFLRKYYRANAQAEQHQVRIGKAPAIKFSRKRTKA